MAELSVHADPGHTDALDYEATTACVLFPGAAHLSIWFGATEVTIYSTPETLPDITGHLHDLALKLRDEAANLKEPRP